jgi:Sortase domain
MRRLGPALLAGLGVLVAVGVPAGWFLTRAPATVNGRAAEALAGQSPRPGSTAAPSRPAGSAGPAPSGRPAGAAVPTTDGRVGAADPAVPAAVPDRLDLPTLRVRAAVRPVGVDRRGDLQIPADVSDVGWYRFGARPGDPAGSTVLSGHVDSAEQGRGAFFRLRELSPGDPVLVHGSDGRTRAYRVVAREEWPKSEVPLDRLFARTGAARLTLVTCGGGFREDVRSYRDNIAVTAVPDGAP